MTATVVTVLDRRAPVEMQRGRQPMPTADLLHACTSGAAADVHHVSLPHDRCKCA